MVRVHWLRMLKVFRAKKEAEAASKAKAKAEAEGQQNTQPTALDVRLVGMRLSDGTQADVMHILKNFKGTGIWIACTKTICEGQSTYGKYFLECGAQTPSLDTFAAVGTASAGAASLDA